MISKQASQDHDEPDLTPYMGRWVALLGNRIVGQGGTPEQALVAAKSARYKETPRVMYVPLQFELIFSPLLEKVVAFLPENVTIYLVGGAVRDALLRHLTHDLDFVLQGDVFKIARQVADSLGAAYFPLDEERGTARLVLLSDDSREVFDFASMRGTNLEADLRARDFTINAMAVDVHRPQELLDPLGSAIDLWAKSLRACSTSTFQDDPLRVLRAIRLAAVLKLKIVPETLKLMRHSVPGLAHVSAERIRDELFNILNGPKQATALRALDMLKALPFILPGITSMHGVAQSPPHEMDVWDHTLNVMKKLEFILNALTPTYNPDSASNLILGLLVLRLGRFRQQISDHFNRSLIINRPLRALQFMAVLYHDSGKPLTQVSGQGKVSFNNHAKVGAQLATKAAVFLRLSNSETERLVTIVRHHLQPFLISKDNQQPSRKAIYHFFRETQEAGIDICLLSLADLWATYGESLSSEVWSKHLNIIRVLLEAWWEHPEESISPLPLLNGTDLINELQLTPGPLIGKLLEAIRESQATGQVHTRQEALDLVNKLSLQEKQG